MTNTNETVEVPVDYVRRMEKALRGEGFMAMADQAKALLSKPKPRLVAVDLSNWDDDNATLVVGVLKRSHPDLLTVLDEVADLFDNANQIKDANRAALGVTE